MAEPSSETDLTVFMANSFHLCVEKSVPYEVNGISLLEGRVKQKNEGLGLVLLPTGLVTLGHSTFLGLVFSVYKRKS